MGDRANVCVKGDRIGENPVFLYAHWSGHQLPEIVAKGLERGRGRWGDSSYLARILFCELIGPGDVLGETGFGISSCVQDNDGYPIIVVDDDNQVVGLATEEKPTEAYVSMSYEEFIKIENPSWDSWKTEGKD
jgi:hypothetical protein